METKLALPRKQTSLFGRDLICTQDWTLEELYNVLQLAALMKQKRYDAMWRHVFLRKTLLMLFYNTSLRTRMSFESAATELGGHAQYMKPSMCRFKTKTTAGEDIGDVAKVISRYAAGVGVRIAEEAVPYYGAGHEYILEFAKWADVPVINMASDIYHPCQALADVMGWAQWLSQNHYDPDYRSLRNKNLLMTWARGGMARTWSSVHSALLIASRFGMNVTVARPHGYDLDESIYKMAIQNCGSYGTNFKIIDDPDSGYQGAHVVYSRNWVSPNAYRDDKLQLEKEVVQALKHDEWITTDERMSFTDDAIYTHCMPIDRGNEVTDTVASGKRSAVYDIAENRLHVQKAIMALTMGELSTM